MFSGSHKDSGEDTLDCYDTYLDDYLNLAEHWPGIKNPQLAVSRGEAGNIGVTVYDWYAYVLLMSDFPITSCSNCTLKTNNFLYRLSTKDLVSVESLSKF